MSISGALSNALSGLGASSRAAETVASNISNATNEGYVPRDVELAARTIGGRGGVSVTGIVRHVDEALLSERRVTDARFAKAETGATFLAKLTQIMGLPDDSGALGNVLSEFDASLVSAASRPESTTRLDIAVSRAGDVVAKLNEMSDGIQALREAADRDINVQVDRLNTLLRDVEEINARLVKARGHEEAALLDQRDVMISDIAAIVPVKSVARANNGIALYTPNGAILFEGQAAEIGFAPTPTIMPHMTQQAGFLSGLTINGSPISNDPPGGALWGGSLGALFEMRDQALVDAQALLDGLARELGERFQGAAIDPTLNPGDAGLFTDGGAAILASNETGLAGRLSLSASVDPEQAGQSWRLRDGLAATGQGLAGNGALLTAMSKALSSRQVSVSGILSAQASSIHGVVAHLQSDAAAALNAQERQEVFAAVRRDALLEAERAGGVDTDSEMQKLLLIEQSYAANARVLETVGKLIDTLMRI
jgi:flagellar hook-associated protein 1 FlgK